MFLDEETRRRPTWTAWTWVLGAAIGSRPIQLLDGQQWYIPFPALVSDGDPPVLRPENPEIHEVFSTLLDPGTVVENALRYHSLARILLQTNYDLTDDEVADLVPFRSLAEALTLSGECSPEVPADANLGEQSDEARIIGEFGEHLQLAIALTLGQSSASTSTCWNQALVQASAN
jgi:hypothetical protein